MSSWNMVKPKKNKKGVGSGVEECGLVWVQSGMSKKMKGVE